PLRHADGIATDVDVQRLTVARQLLQAAMQQSEMNRLGHLHAATRRIQRGLIRGHNVIEQFMEPRLITLALRFCALGQVRYGASERKQMSLLFDPHGHARSKSVARITDGNASISRAHLRDPRLRARYAFARCSPTHIQPSSSLTAKSRSGASRAAISAGKTLRG